MKTSVKYNNLPSVGDTFSYKDFFNNDYPYVESKRAYAKPESFIVEYIDNEAQLIGIKRNDYSKNPCNIAYDFFTWNREITRGGFEPCSKEKYLKDISEGKYLSFVSFEDKYATKLPPVGSRWKYTYPEDHNADWGDPIEYGFFTVTSTEEDKFGGKIYVKWESGFNEDWFIKQECQTEYLSWPSWKDRIKSGGIDPA